MAARMGKKATDLDKRHIAGILARGNPKIKAALLGNPALIELKRNQLLLQRAIKNGRKQK